MTHTCHARGCNVAIPPKLFMCKHHWYSVPKLLRDAVWAAYRPGQEVRKNPTVAYLDAADAAIKAAAVAEVVARKKKAERERKAKAQTTLFE